MSSTRSRGPEPPGVVPAREGGRTAAPDHADAAERCGSRTRGGADPPKPSHGPPVPPPAWELLQHPAAEGGELQGLWVHRDYGQCLNFMQESCEPCIFLV